jgi:prophage regulatory protein
MTFDFPFGNHLLEARTRLYIFPARHRGARLTTGRFPMTHYKTRADNRRLVDKLEARSARIDPYRPPVVPETARSAPLRLLRLTQVMAMTGLGKTKIYDLQSAGEFPMRVQITAHSVGWIEQEVQAWIEGRVAAREFRTGKVKGEFRPPSR